MKKILVVSPDYPYPATHGGKIDVMRQLEALALLDVEVHLVICGKGAASESSHNHLLKFVSKIIYVNRTSSILDILSLKPYQAQSRRYLKKIKFETIFDWVFVEGEYVMEVLKNPTLQFKKSLLRINNIESKYFYQVFLSTLPKISALYYLLDAIKFVSYSKAAFKKNDYLAFVSNDELNWYKRNYPNANNAYLLIQHFDVRKFLPYKSTNEKKVLFVGSLFMSQNIEGLVWYLKNVHPKLLTIPGYFLNIVGSTNGDSSIPKMLQKQFGDIPNLEINTDVPDLTTYYSEASVFVNPILKGAGIKVKTLHAVQYGLPVVTTYVGAEGIGLVNEKDIYIADDPEEFAARVKDSLTNKTKAKEMVTAAQNYLREIDGEKVISKILEIE